MASKVSLLDIKCPFYLAQQEAAVKCEGIIPDTSIRNIFKNNVDKNFHMRVWCAENFAECECYKAINQKYTEEGVAK